jgi:hypothetical protein
MRAELRLRSIRVVTKDLEHCRSGSEPSIFTRYICSFSLRQSFIDRLWIA